MLKIDAGLTPLLLKPKLDRFWTLSGKKILAIEQKYDTTQGSPVFTVKGQYTSRGWTEWTQGFQYGSALLQFDATGEEHFLKIGRENTIRHMAPHVTHFGVHDHGFNNLSTYGNLRRLMNEQRIPENSWEREFYDLALKCSGAVQAHRWTNLGPNSDSSAGFIYSFNGPHSLFADTIRSLRILAVAHRLGHGLLLENDQRVSLLQRLVEHARTTSRYIVFYGENRDVYDIAGRVAHEACFNTNNGVFRCVSTQQGYSGFSTWTRGLAWIMCGYAEQLEFLATCKDDELATLPGSGGRSDIESSMLKSAQAACEFYLANTPTDGVPYWDTGAPGLTNLGHYLDRPADPFNDHEPVDSSAAAIAAQGLLRLGAYLQKRGDKANGERYWQAGLTVMSTILSEPYLSTDSDHQGLTLHSVYHRPNGWDYQPPERRVPCGESSMWGDYHAREAALYLSRIAQNKSGQVFWG